MKTVRFSKIVEKAGRPEIHLTLIDPAKDRALQAAVKANRVMTVSQETTGNKTDRGEIGFQAGTHRQYLVFPKSLKTFAGRTVVGIKYDLLEERELPRNERAKPIKEPKAKEPGRAEKTKPKLAPTPKVVPFRPKPVEEESEEDEIANLKKQVRHAMAVLEEGKAVAAFNLLKRIVGD